MNTFTKFAVVIAGAAVGLIAADTVPRSDQEFAKSAAGAGMAEVQMGQLAVSKGNSQKVKDFGQRMVDDHTKAGDQLKSIAGPKNISLPSDLTAKDKALKAHLSNLSGDAFDKAYMSAMLKDHEAAVSLFQKEANSGTDNDLKSFASTTLPTLNNHLSMAKDAASSVGATK